MKHPTGNIYLASVPTKVGNMLQFFFNPDLNLMVVDLIATNGIGGVELVRQTLDEVELLKHLEVLK